MGHLRSPRPPKHSYNSEEVRKDVFKQAPERPRRKCRCAVTQPSSRESLLQFQSGVNTAALLTARCSGCTTERKDTQDTGGPTRLRPSVTHTCSPNRSVEFNGW
ncbi:hypothetical protein AOLI_G00275340 [Acnodon oligacanthus]